METKKERREKEEVWQNRIIYSLPVRGGYWVDELALKEQNQYLFDYKKRRCQLLIQKTRKMFKNLTRPMTLASENPSIHYGKIYQIKSHKVKRTPCGRDTTNSLFVSGLITEREIDFAQHFQHGCMLSASPYHHPCVRNTFVFVECDSEKIGGVCYGEDVYIQATESANLPLYVQCENSTMDNFGGHLTVRFSQSPDIYCRFKIFHCKPQLRRQTLGSFVDHDDWVIIQHVASGRNLAAEFHQWLPTLFGPECVLSCHTFRDTHRMETAENLWKIVGTQLIGMDFINAARANPGNV